MASCCSKSLLFFWGGRQWKCPPKEGASAKKAEGCAGCRYGGTHWLGWCAGNGRHCLPQAGDIIFMRVGLLSLCCFWCCFSPVPLSCASKANVRSVPFLK